MNNQANIYRLARVNTDGSLDQTFNTGNGANSFVSALAIDSSGKVVIGGAFTSFNGVSRNRIARVNANGSLDTTFGAHSQGADGTVWALGIDSNSDDPDRRRIQQCQHLPPPLHCPAAARWHAGYFV